MAYFGLFLDYFWAIFDLFLTKISFFRDLLDIFDSNITTIFLNLKWTRNGPEMDRKWTRNGSEMDLKWTGYGPEMDRKWTGNGPEMDRK